MAGFFFSYWADFVGEVGSVLWGSKDALPRAAGFVYACNAAEIIIVGRLVFLSLILVGLA